jgi:hypothetical protein
MTILLKIRNDFVHYKIKFRKGLDDAPNHIKQLEKRKIALPRPDGGGDFDWTSKICTTEGIRWAHNTSCRVIYALVSFAPESERDIIFNGLPSNFVEIPESTPIKYFKERGFES